MLQTQTLMFTCRKWKPEQFAIFRAKLILDNVATMTGKKNLTTRVPNIRNRGKPHSQQICLFDHILIIIILIIIIIIVMW